MNVSATDMRLPASGWRRGRGASRRRDERVEAGHDRRDVAQERGVIEARVELGEAEPLRDDRIDREQVAERAALVRRAQRAALDDRVCLVARQPALLDERDEDATAGVQPQAALDVLAHALP